MYEREKKALGNIRFVWRKKIARNKLLLHQKTVSAEKKKDIGHSCRLLERVQINREKPQGRKENFFGN